MRLAATLSLVFCFTCAPAVAEDARFSVSLRGLNAGSLAYRADETGGRYRVEGQALPAGLARTLYPGSAVASVEGRVDGNSYAPASYAENVTKRGESKSARFTYSRGVPKVVKNPPDRKRKKFHARPRDQKGTVDPLTTVFAILRDRPADLACNLDISPFDGRERTRIRMSNGSRKGDRLVCPGTYSRVAGFSPKEMAEKVHWPFTVTYQIGADGLHKVERVDVPTTIGTVVFRRR